MSMSQIIPRFSTQKKTSQDTKEYLNQSGTTIGAYWESEKGGIKGEAKRGEVAGE